MDAMLANAALSPSSDSNVELILMSSCVVLATAIAGFIPIHLARVNRSPSLEVIIASIVLWGLITAGSISFSIMKQMDWSATYLQRIETGYADPQDVSDKPRLPVSLWGGSAMVYAAIALWAGKKNRQSQDHKANQ